MGGPDLSGAGLPPPSVSSVPDITIPQPSVLQDNINGVTPSKGYAPFDSTGSPPAGVGDSFNSIPGGTLAGPNDAAGTPKGGNAYGDIGAVVALHNAEIYAATEQGKQRFQAQKTAIEGMDWQLAEGMEGAQQTMASGEAESQMHLAQANADYMQGFSSCINAGTALATFAVSNMGEAYQKSGIDEEAESAEEEYNTAATANRNVNEEGNLTDEHGMEITDEAGAPKLAKTPEEMQKLQDRAESKRSDATDNANRISQKWSNIGQMMSGVSQGASGALASFSQEASQIQQAQISMIKAVADTNKQIADSYQRLAQTMQQDFQGMAKDYEDNQRSFLGALDKMNDARTQQWTGAA